MSTRLRVELAAPRYARALLALSRANHAWHRLDAALVGARRQGAWNTHLDDAWEALSALERQLGRLTTILGH
jgi:hypothetical protein